MTNRATDHSRRLKVGTEDTGGNGSRGGTAVPSVLKHHRDRTVHEGIRTTQHSLKGCVDCHASKKTGTVIGTSEHFCQGCHEYASVKLDCWECHTPKARNDGKVASGNKP